jgi:hypothetical protein
MRPKRNNWWVIATTTAIGAAVLIVGVIQWFEHLIYVGGCYSEDMSKIEYSMSTYKDAGKPDIPSRDTLTKWLHANGKLPFAESLPSGCQKGAYIWGSNTGLHWDDPAQPVVWCSHPHGIVWRWRNVLFADGFMQEVEETRFQEIIRDAGDKRK